MIEKIFSRDVVTVVADGEMWTKEPHPEEAAFVRNAVAKRKREFAAGRNCARRALLILGVEPGPVLVGSHREPIWPPGVVGSLTHCGAYCAAAVAREEQFVGLGVDAEASDSLDPKLISMVCTPGEVEWVKNHEAPPHGDWHKVIFSAKESVYKCIFPLVRRVLEHHEVEIRLDRSSHRFSVQLLFESHDVLRGLAPLRGRYAIGYEYIVTGVSIARGQDSPRHACTPPFAQ
jgi:4'-phosphopantetheinyl transferase EntD